MSPEARERAFDDLATQMASGSISRGKALRLMGAALVGGALASLGLGGVAAADEECKPLRKKCRKNAQCCSGKCEGNVCVAACTSTGGSCGSNGDCCSGRCAGGMCAEPCSSDRVLLSNGTCALPCNDESGCPSCGTSPFCGLDVSGAGYCAAARAGQACSSDINCPTGQYCNAGGTCGPAC